MKRFLSILLVAALALALFAGCSNATPSSSSEPDTSSEVEVEEPEEEESEEEEPEVEEPTPELDTPAGSGTAEARVSGYGGPIVVTVTVEEDVITEVKVNDEFETADIGGTAARTLEAAIVESGNLEVDVVAGATVTSEAVLLGCRQALAEIAAGN